MGFHVAVDLVGWEAGPRVLADALRERVLRRYSCVCWSRSARGGQRVTGSPSAGRSAAASRPSCLGESRPAVSEPWVLEPAGCAEDRWRQIVGRAWGRRGSIESISERVPGGTISAVAKVAFWEDPRFPWPGCVRGGDGGGGPFGWLSLRLSGALFLAPFSTPPVWRFNPRKGGSPRPFRRSVPLAGRRRFWAA
jgi:hypothetical protein